MVKKILMACVLAGGALLTALPAGASELKSLRGDLGVSETDPAPPVYEIQQGGAIAKAYRQQPPLIPHRIEKYEIDMKVNQCLRCHDWPYNVQENAPKVSETHYVSREGVRTDGVARTRWFCTQCHVPQADAKPLVENVFTPATAR